MILRFSMVIILVITLTILTNSQPVASAREASAAARASLRDTVSDDERQAIVNKVDKIIREFFYDPAKLSSAPGFDLTALEKKAGGDKSSYKMTALSAQINQQLHKLWVSHTQFVCDNDESFYFLHSLFQTLRGGKKPRKAAQPSPCTGFVTGGPAFEDNQIRYVLSGSPAARAGLEVGDIITSIDDKPYIGYYNWLDKPIGSYRLRIKRGPRQFDVTLAPVVKEAYAMYVDATKASLRKIQAGSRSLGYIHLWTGGTPAAEALKELVCEECKDVDGLILDLRDGYGGASLNDLDIFFRPAKAYPDIVSRDRKGKEAAERLYFDKPLVVLINSGSRSGKELLAYGLKNSGRAILVGERTAGAVVAGRLFYIDDRCALYLAVSDIELRGGGANTPAVRLEGQGVAPDIEILNKSHDQNGYGLQLKAAIEALEKQLGAQKEYNYLPENP